MSLRKRKRSSVWWIDLVAPDGRRIRQSTGTEQKALAQELHDKLKAELWRVSKLGERPSRTWNEAVVRWLNESGHKATLEMDKAHLRWVDPYLGGKTAGFDRPGSRGSDPGGASSRGCE